MNQGVAEVAVSVEGGKVWRWQDVTSGGVTLVPIEMSEDNVLDTEAGVVRTWGTLSLLYLGGERERARVGLRDTEENRVRDSSMTVRGNPHSLKYEDILDVFV